MKQLVTTFSDVEIYVDENGRFHASDGNNSFKDSTLAGIKRKISKSFEAVPFIESSYNDFEFQIVKAVPTGKGLRDPETGKKIDTWRLYDFDEQVYNELVELYREYRELSRRRAEIVGKLKRVSDRF